MTLNPSVAELVGKRGFVSGVDARFKTKSGYMKFNCESRIRGYMKEVLLQTPKPTDTQLLGPINQSSSIRRLA